MSEQTDKEAICKLTGRVAELEADNKRLREALEKYGRHKCGCKYPAGVVVKAERPCTCGLAQALKGEQVTRKDGGDE